MQNPFHRFNLRCNPFGEMTREQRVALAVVDVNLWVKFLRHDDSVLQFVGEQGRGKTTHLLAIAANLPKATYIYLPEDERQPKVPSTRPLLVDEAQRLSAWKLHRILRRGGAIGLGTHVDLSRTVHRYGRRLQTVLVSELACPQRLFEILNRRIEFSRMGRGAVPRVSLATAAALDDQFGSDLRAVEHHLYEQLQHCVAAQAPWPLCSGSSTLQRFSSEKKQA